MSRGRPLDSTQRNKTIVLSVNDVSIWTDIRQIAISNNVPLSRVVEEALVQYLSRNVRQANS